MKQNRLFLDIHAIQTLPPSNINRDDTGAPKTAQYGGVTRARVSSQSWKRAMRKYFHENSAEKNVGIRSLNLVQYLANKIRTYNSDITEEESITRAETIFKTLGIKTKDGQLRALFFLGDEQANKLAEMGANENYDKVELKAAILENPAIDVALFGRMVADDSSLTIDASSQVAHALSTHAVQTEFDFFTALDDLNEKSNAGMLGNTEFNSSTVYRYANIALHDLYDQIKMKNSVINAVKLYIESFIKSLPTGKINSFANQSLPSTIVVTLRTDRPISMTSAFEKPIKSNDGYIEKSTLALCKEYQKVQKLVDEPALSVYISLEEINNDLMHYLGEEEQTIKSLLTTVENKLTDLIENID